MRSRVIIRMPSRSAVSVLETLRYFGFMAADVLCCSSTDPTKPGADELIATLYVLPDHIEDLLRVLELVLGSAGDVTVFDGVLAQ